MTTMMTFAADDGCPLAVHLDGSASAPPLVLMHSLGVDASMWSPQLSALAERYRVIRPDLRGHGRSGVPEGSASMDRLGRDVLNLLDALELQTVTYCGLSIGGMIGQWLGYRAPERLDRLVLANTTAYMGPPSNWRDRIATVMAEGMAPLVPAVLERWFTPDFRSKSPAAVDRVRAVLSATAPGGYAACCAAIRDMDFRPTAGLIRVPTLVIGGTADPATPPEHAQWLAAAIPNARLVLLDAAHLSNIEQPDAFLSALLPA